MKKILLIVCGLVFYNLALASDVYDRDIMVNGNFEDQLNGWTCSNCNEDENIVYNDVYYTHYLSLGNLGKYEEAVQTVAISAETGKAEFSYSCDFATAAVIDTDYFTLAIKDHETGENYIRQYVYPSDSASSCGDTYNLSSYAGKTIDIVFGVNNDSADLTTASIDDVTLNEKSYAYFRARVFDKHYNKLKNTKVLIRRYDGDKIWEGKTNSNGIFKATHLKGNPYYKAFIIFKKNGIKEKFRRYIDWGKSYNKQFHLKTI